MIKHCPQLRIQLQELKSLFSKYCLAFEQAKSSKEYEAIFSMQKEIENKINELQELIPISLEKAREIMGADFLGPDAVEKSLGVRLEQRDIPAIPFSKEDLDRALELGQMLILRVDKAPDGEALSMVKLNSLVKEKLKKANKGKALADEAGWKQNEDFYTTEAPETRWALVSKELVPNSLGKNYLEQTELLSSYLQNEVFRDMSLPTEYADALAEYEAAKGDIERIMGSSDWQEDTKRLSELKINQLTRQLPVEAFYDILVRLLNSGERSLKNTYTRTKRSRSYGKFVVVGFADAGGARVFAPGPGIRDRHLGVSFSRSL